LHDDGHIVGNHSFYHHWNFDLLSSKKMRAELLQTDDAIKAVLGVQPRYFRPPYGVTNPNLAMAIGNDYRAIGWSVRSFDTVIKDPVKLMKRVTKNLKGGDIVLFHDHSEVMHKILPDFIKHVELIGLKIVRLDKLIDESPYTTSS
jgi:peptidoglycan/xylan/chitin deacetylase (PgdA/CDA1 family)